MMNAERFISLARKTACIAKSNASWETKHDLIFSREISKQIYSTDISFEYCDPDMSYEEDVIAFVSAINDKADDLCKALQGDVVEDMDRYP